MSEGADEAVPGVEAQMKRWLIFWIDNKLRQKAWWRKWRGIPAPVGLLSISRITNEALKVLERDLRFSADINREPLFPHSETSKTISIRRPKRFIMRKVDEE
jgi:predicted solute-binding protein